MNLTEGVDFTQAEVTEALALYAKRHGASVPEDLSSLSVQKLGSRIRQETGCILRLIKTEHPT